MLSCMVAIFDSLQKSCLLSWETDKLFFLTAREERFVRLVRQVVFEIRESFKLLVLRREVLLRETFRSCFYFFSA